MRSKKWCCSHVFPQINRIIVARHLNCSPIPIEWATKWLGSLKKSFLEQKNKERQILNEMLDFIGKNEVSKVLIWELSRLGRNAAQVLETLDYLNQIKVSLYILNYNLETLNEDGVVNPMSTFMVQVISSFAQVERENIIQRMRSGYAKHLQEGKSVGRKVGYRKSQETLLNENREVIKYLKKGYSVREVMALTNKSSGLVQKIKKMVG